MVTVAREAVAVSEPKKSQIQLELHNFARHEMGKDLISHNYASPLATEDLQGKPPEQAAQKPRAMSTRLLMHYQGPDRIEATIELDQRFALPVACVMLALVGIPLGVATRKGGKSASDRMHYQGPDRIEATIELDQRFALPVACVMLALVGIPLGVATRKGGKSA